jgi:hypothetical protein
VREVLEAIYEQDFLDCSYVFRPKRSAHDAIRTLDRIVHRGEVNWILEADIVSFFRQLGSQEAEGDARGSGSRWVAVAADREVPARGCVGWRGAFHVGIRHRSGVGVLSAAGKRPSPLRVGSLVRTRGEAATAGQKGGKGRATFARNLRLRCAAKRSLAATSWDSRSTSTTDHGSDLGFVATSRISGGAGWWKSPCPDLERTPGG